jgi:hypothetical protein
MKSGLAWQAGTLAGEKGWCIGGFAERAGGKPFYIAGLRNIWIDIDIKLF